MNGPNRIGGDHIRVMALTIRATVAAYTGRADDAAPTRGSHRDRDQLRLNHTRDVADDAAWLRRGLVHQLR
jgi:hypothetical protein